MLLPRSRFLVGLLLAAGPHAWAEQPTSRVLRVAGGGYLEALGDQAILHVSGTPYEMGWQHGRLFREQLQAWARSGERFAQPRVRRAQPRGFWQSLPVDVQQELRGLAEGAGLRLKEMERRHLDVLSALSECAVERRAAAAWATATADRKLYHVQGLCGDAGSPTLDALREAAILVVAAPSEGLPHAYPSWVGFVGASSGINGEGLCVGGNAVESRDAAASGLPTPFLVREILRRTRTLDEATRLLARLPRAGGSCFIVSDGKVPAAAAVETTRSLCHVLRPDDKETSSPQRLAIPDVVRRTTHFVHPATAATQPDPRSAAAIWADWAFSQALMHYRGRLDAPRLIRCLHDRPASLRAICQAVYCPTDRALWLAHPGGARPEQSEERAWRFQRYRLADLLDDRRVPLIVDEPPAERRQPTLGLCHCDDTLKPLSDPDPEVNELLAPYNFPADPFPWRLRAIQEKDDYTISRLSFPSPARYAMLEANTVHAEYYQPRHVRGRVPAVIVLHILDGRFFVARMVCRHFAAAGIPSLMVQMPYYGERRPHGTSLFDTFHAKPSRMFEAMRGTALDARRAASWLQKRPEVDPQRIGVVGVSLGAIAAGIVVGIDPRFNRNVLVLGGGDPAAILWNAPETSGIRDRLEELGYTLESLRELARGVDPIVFARRVNPKQVLMINALNDETLAREYTVALWEAIGRPAIHWYPAGHYSMGLFIPTVLPSALHFVQSVPLDSSR